MTAALIIVDVQNDFCSGGRLAVPDAGAVIPVINDLKRGFRHVFLTQEWHPYGHISFASSHPGYEPFSRMTLPSGEQVLWPDLRVENTPGAEFHSALEIPWGSTVVRKGTRRDIDSYSAFLENDRKTPVALDARTLGYDVTVVEAACRGIDIDGFLEAAWKQMADAGVRRA